MLASVPHASARCRLHRRVLPTPPPTALPPQSLQSRIHDWRWPVAWQLPQVLRKVLSCAWVQHTSAAGSTLTVSIMRGACPQPELSHFPPCMRCMLSHCDWVAPSGMAVNTTAGTQSTRRRAGKPAGTRLQLTWSMLVNPATPELRMVHCSAYRPLQWPCGVQVPGEGYKQSKRRMRGGSGQHIVVFGPLYALSAFQSGSRACLSSLEALTGQCEDRARK